MKLSILMATIPERADLFRAIYQKTQDQVDFCNRKHPTLGGAEILIDDREKFTITGITVGKKRNDLLQRATGEYICFLDDDDDISPDYVETILRLAENNRDICTFNSFFVCDSYWALVDMRMGHDNEQATPDRIVKRQPFPICAIKTSIARQFTFPDINNAEDWGWMSQVLTKARSESKSHRILHQYKHSAKTSAVDAIENDTAV